MSERGEARLGASCIDGGVEFRVWAPRKRRVDVCVAHDGRIRAHRLRDRGDGLFSGIVKAVAGDRYVYLVDGNGPLPDPASRFQPFGVHGPSEIVDSRAFVWSDADWHGIALERAVIYELHVGTFTAEGTFAAAIERFPYLQDLGVTALELMPVSDFAGDRNWGYDVAALFAPARCYGRPDDLRRLVDAAHRHGLAVLLDVVYNHLGPDGAYQPAFNPRYFSRRHRTSWGAGINLDGADSASIRSYLIENAIYWLQEFHFDGLRLDATHALVDRGPRHFLAELTESVRRALHPRTALLIAEDERNEARLVRAPAAGGYGLDAVWADDFHHHVRRLAAGDHESFFAHFSGTPTDIAATIERGWFYRGQPQLGSGEPRGTDPAGLAPAQFVVCLQNHDQIGNRAFGERLHHQIDPALYRALSVLLLSLPETPLLFMGQEWSADTPFLFFTDHAGALGAQISAGRRREFKAFRAFADAQTRAAIPDPQDPATFVRSRLDWNELVEPQHAAMHALYRACLWLRQENCGRLGTTAHHACEEIAPGVVALLQWSDATAALTVVNLRHDASDTATAEFCARYLPQPLTWRLQLHSEQFALDSSAPVLTGCNTSPAVTWSRRSAVVLRGSLHAGDGVPPRRSSQIGKR